MHNKIPVIIQATNFFETTKNRSFEKLGNTSVLKYLIQRLKQEYDGKIILATSTHTDDDIFETDCMDCGIAIYRGDLKNVLERLIHASKKLECENFVRIFANNPLCDINAMMDLIASHLNGNYEYSYNEHNQGVLWGTGCEIFRVTCLEKVNSLDLNQEQKETISFYLQQNSNLFKINRYIYTKKRKGYKLSLESKKDLYLIRDIVKHVEHINNPSIYSYLDEHPILNCYNLDEPAKEIGIEKLFLHTKKVEQIINNTNQLDFSYPVSVELSLTNSCNLKCIYCSDQLLRTRQGLTKSIQKHILFQLFEDLAKGGTTGIVIEGGGEPTIYTDFEEVVYYAKKTGLAVGLITNGTLHLSKKILSAFEWIRVSLDASTQEEYFQLKGVDCFEKVLSNIFYYKQYCPTVGVGFVVTKNNISQIEALVLRLRQYMVSYVQFRPVVDCEELFPYGEDLNYLKYYQTSTFGIIIDGMSENALSGNFNLPCLANSLTTVISSDGSVYLCGRLNIYNWISPIGNITRTTFYDIWNGKERKRQLEIVRNPDFCKKNCPQCRISKFNQLFNHIESIQTKNFI